MINKKQVRKHIQSEEQGKHSIVAATTSLRKIVCGILWKTALKGRVARENWQVFKDSILQAQEYSITILKDTSSDISETHIRAPVKKDTIYEAETGTNYKQWC